MATTLTSLSNQWPAWLLVAGGAALGWVRNFWHWLYSHTAGQVVRRITVSVNVEEFDHGEAYLWLQAWVEEKLRARRLSALQLRKRSQGAGYNRPVFDEDTDQDSQSSYELIPAYGVYPFRWRRRYLVVFGSTKENGDTSPGGGSMFSMPRRSVILTIWGSRDRNLLLELIEEARAQWERTHPATLRYFYHRNNWWRSKPLPERRKETVYFPEGLVEDVLDDARRFLARRDSFQALGVPWRRGMLFYGPPGTGKTTLVQCLATELRLPIFYLSLASLKDRNDLADLLDSVTPGSILLIEDVDCISAAAERMSQANEPENGAAVTPQTTSQPSPARANQAQEKISPSDLLNLIDGIIASQGRLLVMTTNYPELLDRALTRSGRVDRKWFIDYPKESQLKLFLDAARAHGLTTTDWPDLRAKLPKNNATVADAQALLFGAPEVNL